jgi:hypothetical protein
MNQLIDKLDKSRQMPYAMGQAMKNPALMTATLGDVPYTRGQHRQYWAALRNRKAGTPLTVHLSF